MPDGTCTRRLNELVPIATWVNAPFGQPITITNGTLTIYKGVRNDTTYPLSNPPLFIDKSVTQADNPTPGTGRVIFNATPNSLGMQVDQKYTLLFKLTFTAGTFTYTKYSVVILTVIDDLE